MHGLLHLGKRTHLFESILRRGPLCAGGLDCHLCPSVCGWDEVRRLEEACPESPDSQVSAGRQCHPTFERLAWTQTHRLSRPAHIALGSSLGFWHLRAREGDTRERGGNHSLLLWLLRVDMRSQSVGSSSQRLSCAQRPTLSDRGGDKLLLGPR